MDEPAGSPLVEPAEIAALIEHQTTVDANETLAEADRLLQLGEYEYAAVILDGRAIGMCRRSEIRRLIGGQYGFALFRRARIREHLVRDCLSFGPEVSLRDMLPIALGRQRDDFYHDVMAVDADSRLLGLISTRRLVQAQSALIAEQFQLVDQQRVELEAINGTLNESLSHRRALERQIVQEEKAALLQTLAGGIAHEINNKLVPIVGYIEFIEELAAEYGNRVLTEYCGIVRGSALESAQIIRQLLELSKPSPPERKPHDLRVLVEQALTFLQLRLKEAGVHSQLQMPPAAVSVLVDVTQVKQLVVNLILNALDAMAECTDRHLTIHLEAAPTTACLSVSDSGPGICVDHLTRIFDPFFTTKGPKGGTGLGLSVCLSIARQHGGDIVLVSEVGAGATFRISLPLDVPCQPTAERSAEFFKGPSVRYPHASVLVVDDEPAGGRLVRDALRNQLGCDAEWVPDGASAIQHLCDGQYALVVSDVRMPKVDGVQLLQWIRTHRPELASRLLFMTGDAGPSERNAAVKRAGVRVLNKPFTLAALVGACRHILSGAADSAA